MSDSVSLAGFCSSFHQPLSLVLKLQLAGEPWRSPAGTLSGTPSRWQISVVSLREQRFHLMPAGEVSILLLLLQDAVARIV